jgi:hypothetical protein
MSDGSAKSPTTLSKTTRSKAACTAGGAVDISSRNKTPLPWSAKFFAHCGGAKRTPPSTIIGRPEKSLGSRILAITTSHERLADSAKAITAELLPVPGEPHKTAGTPAAIASDNASRETFVGGVMEPFCFIET